MFFFARSLAAFRCSALYGATVANKRFLIDLKITPFFGKMPLNEIKATDIRRWQNQLTGYRDEKGEPYSQTYLKTIQNQLTAIFNYAVKYYSLKENPCHKAGSMGKKNADEMLFWTKEEFGRFIEAVMDKPASFAIYMTLYYTGMREGELLALTPADIDLDKMTIRINKSYQRLNGQDVISTPKTPKSNRIITIPTKLGDCLKDYMGQCYDLQPTDRLFPYTKYFLTHEMERGCKISGVKRIRVHDTRHSHASLLVEMGFSPLLIAERLGHERVETTMEIYSHLYPNKQTEVANRLDDLM
jgi:integrase